MLGTMLAARPRTIHVTTCEISLAADEDVALGDPQQRWPSTAAAAGAGFLCVAGLFSVTLGVHDALFGLRLSSRVAGSAMLACGFVMLLGGIVVLKRRQQGAAFGLAGAVLCAAIGVLMTLGQVVNRGPEPVILLVLWLSLAGVGGATAWALRSGWPTLRQKLVASALLTSLLSVAALVSVMQFWYSAFWVPSAAAPSISVMAELRPAAPAAGMSAVTATITLRNTSATKVRILGSRYFVTGFDGYAVPRGRDVSVFSRDIVSALRGARLDKADPEPFLVSTTRSVLAVGWVTDQEWLEPSESTRLTAVVRIPVERFRTLRLTAWLYEGKGRSLDIAQDQATFVWDPATRELRRVQRVQHPGWLAALTRGPVRVTTTVTGLDIANSVPGVSVFITRPDGESVARFYGGASTGTTVDLALDALNNSRRPRK